MATTPRTWLAGGGLLLVVLAVASWMLLLAPQRAQADDLRAQTAQQQLNDQTLGARVQQLRAQSAELPGYLDELEALRQALPADTALPALVRSVRDSAATAGVELDGLVPGTAVAAAAPATAGGAAPAADGTAAAGATGAASTGASTTASTGAGSGLLTVPVTLTASGTWPHLELFLQSVQSQPRALLVSGATVGADTSGASGSSEQTMTITGSVFVLPDDGEGAAATAASAASAAGAAAASGAAAAGAAAGAAAVPSAGPAGGVSTS